ncbi:hypothetical protein E4U19_008130 [Claviceps sp. Clav32 group G5]|nr:hypothetical protein E4U19_008130 [Claviceps sp. Clav32 group G5]KAG6044937.1 hypothetical protein E4U39_002875 [Claviceps sp. Clav50 group G5]
MSRVVQYVVLLAIALSAIASANPDEGLMEKLVKEYHANTIKGLELSGYGSSCTPDNIVVRKEWFAQRSKKESQSHQRRWDEEDGGPWAVDDGQWGKVLAKTLTASDTDERCFWVSPCQRGNLSLRSRREYIDAVKCLHELPSKIDPKLAPGARSRYDDFEAAHIRLAAKIHGTGFFLPWHRHFVHLYETALRDECGYTGYQPYWDWSKYAHRPVHANPLYDGSETSMGSNGRYIPGRNGTVQPLPVPVPDPPKLYCPSGTGGGYVKRGPFAHWTLHLGPVIPMTVRNGMPVRANPRPDGLGYNPRRMIRDFNNTLLLEKNTYKIVNNMLTNMTDIHTFHPYFYRGPHLAGHLFISGYDNDFYSSPGDPLFYFHHAQIDRIWSIWQALDFSKRENALDGTLTMSNVPPTRNVTLEDVMSFEFEPSILVGKRMSPTKDGLCYIYE